MPIRKDETSGIWQVDIRVPGVPRVRCSSGTTDRQAAQEYHDKLKADLWRQAKLGEQPDRFFEEAAVRCLRLWDGLRDYDSKVRHVAYWRSQFSGRAIRSLKFDEIADKLPTHTTHKHRKPTPVSAATKNRYLATLRRMLKLCEDWDWIDKCPKFSEFVEPDNRVRWEPPSVIGRLISAMTLEWMRDVSLVAVATGMREDELLSLRPSNVDMPQRNAWVIAEEAKSGYARSVPLNADAMAVLQRRVPKAKRFVFERPSRDGVVRKISQVDARCLRRACAEVGIDDFHFHDLRHTWASWHVQAGTPLMVLKDLGGWETLDMVQRYAHLAPSHLAHHSNTVEFWSKSEQKEKTPLVIAA
ncbi:tyrosine-type recombinase/integrase [Achromobacter kerstersii]|nr:site-specific integrase [Achromobacter kerstersii]